MPVVASLYSLLDEHSVYLFAFLFEGQRRIVQKQDGLFPCLLRGGYRHTQSACLAQDYLAVGIVFCVKKPAARAAYRDVSAGVGVVMQNTERSKFIFFKEFILFLLR